MKTIKSVYQPVVSHVDMPDGWTPVSYIEMDTGVLEIETGNYVDGVPPQHKKFFHPGLADVIGAKVNGQGKIQRSTLACDKCTLHFYQFPSDYENHIEIGMLITKTIRLGPQSSARKPKERVVKFVIGYETTTGSTEKPLTRYRLHGIALVDGGVLVFHPLERGKILRAGSDRAEKYHRYRQRVFPELNGATILEYDDRCVRLNRGRINIETPPWQAGVFGQLVLESAAAQAEIDRLVEL